MKIKVGLIEGVMILLVVMTIGCGFQSDGCKGVDCSFKGDINADNLTDVIKYYEKKYIKESNNKYDGCFQEVDLERFHAQKTVSIILDEFQKSNTFGKLIEKIEKLSASDRNILFNKGLAIFQPTWAELGAITPKGQTDAGQTAQKEIAAAIVKLVKGKF